MIFLLFNTQFSYLTIKELTANLHGLILYLDIEYYSKTSIAILSIN